MEGVGLMTKTMLTKKETSETIPYAWGVGLFIIPEVALVIVIARIWLEWNQMPFVLVPYTGLAVLLLYWLFVAPARVPSLLTEKDLTITYGHSLKVVIPAESIESLDETMLKVPLMVPFGFERDQKTGVMFMVTGNRNKLLIKLCNPIEIKGLVKNYGYVDEIVFNIDDPGLLKEMTTHHTETKHLDHALPILERPKTLPALISDPNQPVLSLHGVSKEFGEVTAVNNLSLDLFPGELFGLLGTNGAGKTTTLKMVIGLLKPSGGEIIAYQNTMAYMPENAVPYERMSGREFLQFLAVLYELEPAQARNRIEGYLTRFDMQKSANRVIGSYSQGMKRKISLIGTLIKGSSIILLDEPTNGLDPTGIIQVKEILHELTDQGKTIIFSTHILEMAEKLCGRVGILAGGSLIFEGTLDELREATKMRDASLENIFIRLVQAE